MRETTENVLAEMLSELKGSVETQLQERGIEISAVYDCIKWTQGATYVRVKVHTRGRDMFGSGGHKLMVEKVCHFTFNGEAVVTKERFTVTEMLTNRKRHVVDLREALKTVYS